MEDESCQKSPTGVHRWRGTGRVLTSNPPQIPERCKDCGSQRNRMTMSIEELLDQSW